MSEDAQAQTNPTTIDAEMYPATAARRHYGGAVALGFLVALCAAGAAVWFVV